MPRSKKRNSAKIGARFVVGLLSKVSILRKFHFAKLEAAWNSEVLTLDMAIAVALDTAEKTELARLRASREASKATLNAARRGEVARVEAAWCAEIATLEALRRSESTTASYTNHEIKNRLVSMGELCESEAPLEQIVALIEETLETIVRRNTFQRLATGTYCPSPEQIDLSKFVEQRVFRFLPARRHVEVMPSKGDAKSCDALLLDPLLIGIVVDNLSSKNSVPVFAPTRILRRLEGLWSLRRLLESLHSSTP